jgi:DNA topoisomerase-3
MIAERENAIHNFVKTPYYSVSLDCGEFTAASDKTQERGEAERIRALCDGRSAVVTNVESREKSAAPPKLYDLTTLQRDANRIYGYTAQQTLDTAQTLYEKKILTYPRTDSNYITEDMAESAGNLARRAAAFLPYINAPVTVNIPQIVNGKKVSDHHALLPTETALKTAPESLTSAERDILTLVTVRLLEAVGEKHVYRDTNVDISCGGEKFKAKGRVILIDGWKSTDREFNSARKTDRADKTDDDAEGDESKLPDMEKGRTFSPVSASVKEGITAPPKHYTEDTLLAAMENAGAEDMPEDAERRGLGTPATRAGILEKLIKSGFVIRQKKNLLITEKAENLIAVLPENLKSPKMTAEWEHRLKEIEKGETDAEAFMTGIADLTEKLVADNTVPNPEMTALFASGGGDREAIGKCPRCGKRVIDIGKGYCCEDRICKFALWKENKYFTGKNKKITKQIASALIKDGRVFVKGLYSERTKKTYDATILLDDTGGDYVNFRMEF